MDKNFDLEINKQVQAFVHSVGPIVSLAILCAWALLHLICFWRIISKAGFSGCWCIFLFIPCLNTIALVWFAFADWPNMKRPRASKRSE